jgi:hypothetical protein
MTVEQVQAETDLCLATVRSIIRDDMKMMKLCSQSVPHDRTQQQLLALPAEFFALLVTGDESWFSYAIPQRKQQSMHWRHYDSPPKKRPDQR